MNDEDDVFFHQETINGINLLVIIFKNKSKNWPIFFSSFHREEWRILFKEGIPNIYLFPKKLDFVS